MKTQVNLTLKALPSSQDCINAIRKNTSKVEVVFNVKKGKGSYQRKPKFKNEFTD